MSLAEEIFDGTGTDWADDGSLLAWLAGPAAMLQPITDLARDTADSPGWSSILDVTRCPSYALPWLAQFVGVRLDPRASDATQRAAISAEENFGRGTVERIRSVAQLFLIDTQTVYIDERDTSPYHLTVGVLSAELNARHYNDLPALYPTYDDLAAAFGTYDEFTFSVAALSAALLAVKPAGLQMTLDLIDGVHPDHHLYPLTTLYPGA